VDQKPKNDLKQTLTGLTLVVTGSLKEFTRDGAAEAIIFVVVNAPHPSQVKLILLWQVKRQDLNYKKRRN
jgi:hypothetical protein